MQKSLADIYRNVCCGHLQFLSYQNELFRIKFVDKYDRVLICNKRR